jgi:hypothetical protein
METPDLIPDENEDYYPWDCDGQYESLENDVEEDD